MKKIISILFLLVFVSANFSFAQVDCETPFNTAKETYTTCKSACTDPVNVSCIPICDAAYQDAIDAHEKCLTDQGQGAECDTVTETWDEATQKCVPKTNADGATLPAECNIVNGITICEDCLTNGQCKFNIYDTLGIRKSVRATGDATSVGLFVQDIVLSATFFIGTVVTVALIVSGIMYIFAAASGKDPGTAKKGIIGALIGLVIVASSYFIIRLVQYLAKGI